MASTKITSPGFRTSFGLWGARPLTRAHFIPENGRLTRLRSVDNSPLTSVSGRQADLCRFSGHRQNDCGPPLGHIGIVGYLGKCRAPVAGPQLDGLFRHRASRPGDGRTR
jgi:hypothetical protein